MGFTQNYLMDLARLLVGIEPAQTSFRPARYACDGGRLSAGWS
jgi:hypothetical protein